MNKMLLSPAIFLAAFAPAAWSEDAKVKPVLEMKVFALTEAEPYETSGILQGLLGPTDLVIEQAKPKQKRVIEIGDDGEIAAPLWRSAVDDRTRTLAVRGTTRHLAIASEVVAVLNRKPQQPLPETKTIRVIQLKFAKSAEVGSILQHMQFDDLRFEWAGETVLMFVAPEATQKDVETIVKALDVPVKEGAKPSKPSTQPPVLPRP
jgi:hypothetical protein